MMLLILFLNICDVWAYAESVSVFDHSDNLGAYAEKVAEWVRQTMWYPKDEGATRPCIVLIRTQGELPDMSHCHPTVLISGPKNRYTAVFASRDEALQCVSILSTMDDIIYCELDQAIASAGVKETVSGEGTQMTFQSWGAEQMEFDTFNAYAQIAGNSSCTVAIIDSGVYRHELIRPRMKTSGFDYVDIDLDATNDLFGHGTNVAGIIVDCTPDLPVYILPIRILNSSGTGSVANAVNAIDEAVSNGADVINLSLSMQGHSAALDDAILRARSAGVMVVIAAGNDGMNTSLICPAHLQQTGLIVVGAATSGDTVADYSNDGVSVDMYAYGDSIRCCSISGGYTSASGTSMSTPHISAACATLEVLYPGMTAYAMEAWLKAACTDTEASVPRLSRLTPQTLPLRLAELYLPPGQELILFMKAFPLTCQQMINFESSDAAVAHVENGRLICFAEGTTTITVSVNGFLKQSFILHVSADAPSISTLPSALETIESEAFLGNTEITAIYIPEGISIGDNIFGNNSTIVVLCTPGSTAHQAALVQGWPYILIVQD